MNKRHSFFLFLTSFLICGLLQAQNVGIGTSTPSQKLEVAGAVKIGNTSNAASGTIRWNESKSDFEGFNGTAWVSLTGGKNGWGNSEPAAIENEHMALLLRSSHNAPGVHGKDLGYSLAAIDGYLAVGARREYASAGDVGGVLLFKKEGEKWEKLSSKSPDDYSGVDLFGSSVAITGGFVIVGAPGAVVTNDQNQGKAYLYSYHTSGIAGSPLILSLGSPRVNDRFGEAVAINAAYAFVGAPGRDVGVIPSVTNGAGRVYIYQRSGGNWPQLTSFSAPDLQADAGFGSTLTFWNDYLAVGCPYFDTAGVINAGKVYLYRRSGSAWNLVAQVTSPQLKMNGFFGRSITLQEGWLIIGAPNDGEDDAGFVAAYTLNGNTPTLHSSWQAPQSRIGDRFGQALSQSGSVLLVGSPNDENEAVQRPENAYAYVLQNNQWVLQARLRASHGEGNANFGFAVVLLPSEAVIGAPLADVGLQTDNGRLYFFKR